MFILTTGTAEGNLSMESLFLSVKKFCRYVVVMNGLSPSTLLFMDAFISSESWINPGIRR